MVMCVVCSKTIDTNELFIHPIDRAAMHQSCAEVYMPDATPSPAQKGPPTTGSVSCQQCGGHMEQTKKAERNMALQLLGVLLFFVGVSLCFLIPPFGAIAGLIVMVVAARLGYAKKKVWLCENCGYFFERA